MIGFCLQARPARRAQSTTLLRRHLERRVGNVSPSDCRREIAAFLWEKGIFRETDEHSTGQPRVRVVRPRRRRATGPRWQIPAAIGAMLFVILLGVRSEGFGLFRGERQSAVAPPPQAAVAAQPQTASVRFVVYPWAEVRTEDGTRFVTPRAEPVQMKPGRHMVSFEHPRYGKVQRVITVQAGEERVIRHVFDKAPRQ
jgi:hypothetical protein